MVHVRKDNPHAYKELVSVCKRQFQRGTPNRYHYVQLSRRVPCAQITHEIIPELGCRETREVEVFRENFQVLRLPMRQASHQTLLRRSHGRDGKPFTMEHHHCFLHGAESFRRHADGSVEPHSAERSAECQQSELVQQDGHSGAYPSRLVWVGQESPAHHRLAALRRLQSPATFT